MTAPPPRTGGSMAATNVIAALLEARTGQQIGSNRVWRIESALKPLLRIHGFETIDRLAAELTAGKRAPLADAVVEALLNQETSFFRDAGIIDLTIDAMVARSTASPALRPRIWSVGCSTGQEPLSLAMLIAERWEASHRPPDIVATDVSERALARAREGRYSQFEIQRGLPIRRMLQWFDAEGEAWVAKRELVGRIHYRRHNLVGEVPPAGNFDLILCRNVLLYFAAARRRAVFEQLAAALRPGGLLVLGAGETVIGQTDSLVPSPQWRGFYVAAGDSRMRAAHG